MLPKICTLLGGLAEDTIYGSYENKTNLHLRKIQQIFLGETFVKLDGLDLFSTISVIEDFGGDLIDWNMNT